jgi:hypothetical protein
VAIPLGIRDLEEIGQEQAVLSGDDGREWRASRGLGDVPELNDLVAIVDVVHTLVGG